MSETFDAIAATLEPGGDSEYFRFHRARFAQQLASLEQVAPKGARVLDIGSHYLHMSVALAARGFAVTGLDVAAFQQIEFVRRRAATARLQCETVTDLGRGDFLQAAGNDAFDVIVFCEIMEHITFNPVAFWRRVHALLRPGGFVYVSTPNSLRLTNVIKTAARLLGRRGVGIPVGEILKYVTYGHHWKEYSATEMREYFARLSPDFAVEVRFVDYGFEGPRAATAVRAIGSLVPSLSPHIEAFVRLPKKTAWTAQPRGYED